MPVKSPTSAVSWRTLASAILCANVPVIRAPPSAVEAHATPRVRYRSLTTVKSARRSAATVPDARPEVLETLRACRLWRSASDAAVARLGAVARVEHAGAGAPLVTEGDAALRLGVVIAGAARAYHLGADGREITFEAFGPGHPVAAVAALAGGRYPASIDATEDSAIAWLPRDAVLALLETEPGVARDVVVDLATRLVGFTAVATTLSLDVPQRLARFLFARSLAAGRPGADGLEVDLGMTKAALATQLGTVPETLSRALARLRDDGLITVRGRTTVLHDVGALARLGEGYEEG
ncbi:MAG: Crp/Fnr family transcriptional regulator [Actinobacteria bacterium]|nr:MAG: Crp/Fnr family transcriptional regulator [Actinomycetota bacterium]